MYINTTITLLLLLFTDVYIDKVVSTQITTSSTAAITQEGHHNSDPSHPLPTATTAPTPTAPTSQPATSNTSTNNTTSSSGGGSVWGAKRSFVEVVRKPI